MATGRRGRCFRFRSARFDGDFCRKTRGHGLGGGGGRKEVEREHFPLDLGWLDDLFNGKHGRAGYTSRSGKV